MIPERKPRMKQVIQNYQDGKVRLLDVLPPRCGRGELLVATRASLISIGTERSIIALGRKSLLGKARARPDLVRRVVEKARQEGVASALSQAFGRLDQAVPLGYSSAGVVIETGRDAHRYAPGDRVACIGQGFASHAELCVVPEMLCARLPENMPFESGCFGMVGSIGLHGIRCGNLRFGETVGVVGLGLIGLLTAQMLRAYGCRVVAADADPQKLAIARSLGFDNVCVAGSEFVEVAQRETEGRGLDAVLLTLATTAAEPVDLAVDASRFGGRVVVVGVADIHPNRNALWDKEVELVVSRAAGPGSLDPVYERESYDYPAGLVRWTEGRNLEEFLRLVGEQKVLTAPLVTHRSPIAAAERTYDDLIAERNGPYVGVIFEYPAEQDVSAPRTRFSPGGPAAKSGASNSPVKHNSVERVGIGVLGAGLFGQSVLLPALAKNGEARLVALASGSGVTATGAARKFGFEIETTDYQSVLDNKAVSAVLILTRHSSHARLVVDALEARKHVFVEKPLCVNAEELSRIQAVVAATDRLLTVGYNRRFSPLFDVMRTHFAQRRDPLVMSYRVNAGYVPPEHWVHSAEEGGGRVVGEMCHFIDLMQALSGAMVERVYGERLGANGVTAVNDDNIAASLRMSDGSVATLTYTASGDRTSGRERFEAFADKRSAALEDFRRVSLVAGGRSRKRSLLAQDLGYHGELSAFLSAVAGRGPIPIPLADVYNSTAAVFALSTSLSSGAPIKVR